MNTQKRTNQVLQDFGLSDNESQVYQAALRVGETSPFALAKQTGIPRTTVYTVLTDLALKGLVELERSSGLQKQQTKVRAKNPSVLRDLLWQQRDQLVKQEVDIVSILPFLKQDYLKDVANADFQFYPGREGVMKVHFDLDGVDEDAYVFDYLTPMDVIGSKEMNRGVDRDIDFRSQSKCSEYNLISLTPWSKHVLSYQVERNPDYLSHVEHRTLPFELQDLSIWLQVKGDRTRIVSVKDDEVWGLIIRSHNLAQSLTSIHQSLWRLAQPITKEMISAWGPNQYLEHEKKVK